MKISHEFQVGDVIEMRGLLGPHDYIIEINGNKAIVCRSWNPYQHIFLSGYYLVTTSLRPSLPSDEEPRGGQEEVVDVNN